ncbi:MAG: hypothetical protein Q7S06_01500 [Nanoarchaeota archaeon]|nr:hypothetical protein [Nanoarchaeota archaeon]
MQYQGLNLIKVEGSKFEVGYGYSKFVKLKVNNKSYIPILSALINTWGIKNREDRIEKNILGKIEEKKNYLDFSIKCADIEIQNFIAGYPSIRLGESIWGPTNGFELGQVKKYTGMNISTKWEFQVKGLANFTYDIWLTKNKKGELTKNDIEVMIWLDYNFEPPWKDIGETNDFKIKYVKKDSNWNNGGHVFAFFSKKSSKKSFDLIQVINQCKKIIKNIESYYIRSIDLGIEFSKKTQVEVKLKELNFDFKTR